MADSRLRNPRELQGRSKGGLFRSETSFFGLKRCAVARILEEYRSCSPRSAVRRPNGGSRRAALPDRQGEDSLMRTIAPRRGVWSVLAGLLAVAPAPATRADPVTAYTGFTRPGTPNDSRKPDGQVVLVSTDADASKRAVGGTVYFMVLERKDGDKDGAWGSGIKDLPEHFRRGVDSGGSPSPGLDTGARYLYLYQTVNDRGTDLPVQSAAIELLGDPKKKEVTSWGSFAGLGFALSSGKEGRKEDIEPVSSSTRDAAESEPAYRSPAPAVPARRSYRLSLLPTRRGPFSDQPGDGVAKVVQEVLDPVHEPDYVMVLAGSGEQRSSFRAIWNGYLPRGARSTVYGFTSNRPPTLQPIHLNGIGIQAPGGIRPAAAGEEPGAGHEVVTVSAEGSGPTPRPAAATPLTPETPGTSPPAGPSPPTIVPGPPVVVPVPVPGGSAPGGGGAGSSTSLGSSAGSGFGGGGGGSGSGSGGGSATQARQ